MPFIGNAPARVPLTSADITDGIISSADIANGAITSAKLASGVGGKVLQVVSANTTSSTTNTSTNYVATSLTASITPSSTSNKILVMVLGGECDTGGNNQITNVTIYKNATTNLGNGANGTGTIYGTSSRVQGIPSMGVYDSPATTSSTAYALWIRCGNGGTVTFNANAVLSTIVLMEIAA
jgi:hypothetical protein